MKQLIHVYKVKGGLYKKEKRQYEQKFLRNSDPFRQCMYVFMLPTELDTFLDIMYE